MTELCHIWMSHVTYDWVTSFMNASYHIWMSHVTYVMSHTCTGSAAARSNMTYKWIVSSTNELRHMWRRHVTYAHRICGSTESRPMMPTTHHCNTSLPTPGLLRVHFNTLLQCHNPLLHHCNTSLVASLQHLSAKARSFVCMSPFVSMCTCISLIWHVSNEIISLIWHA